MQQDPSLGGRTEPTVRLNDLTTLYIPSDGSETIADIIFVHGLQGHPRKTWESTTRIERRIRWRNSLATLWKPKDGVSKDSTKRIFWPSHLLPADYANFRVLTYGYDSHISRYFRSPANKLNLSQLGEDLLNRVNGERRRSKAVGRPIIFVAHSLGGLLVKEAILESKKHGPSSKQGDVYRSTKGIVFFGTPHRGSLDARWGQILRSIASVTFDTNDKILRTLEPDNELLDKLARDFNDFLDEGHLKICSLLESAGKTGLPVFNGKVEVWFLTLHASAHLHRSFLIFQRLLVPGSLRFKDT